MPRRVEESFESSKKARLTPRGGRLRDGLRRAWLPVLLSVLGIFALALVGGLLLLANLDHRWVKPRVERLLSDMVETQVGYERLSITPGSGLQLEGLVVRTPEALRPYAAQMLRVGELRIPIEFGPLWTGHVSIPEVSGGPIEVTVVITEDGRDSFSELLQPADGSEDSSSESVPLSRALEALEELPLEIGSIDLAPIRLRAVEVATTGTQQTDLRALGVFSDGLLLGEESAGAVYLLGDGRGEVALTVLETRNGVPPGRRKASLRPEVAVRLEDRRALVVDADVLLYEQSLFPELRPVQSLLELQSKATFDPERGVTTLHVQRLGVLDSMLEATVHAVLQDADGGGECRPRIVPAIPIATAKLEGRGVVDAPSLPWELPWLGIEDLTGGFALRGLEIEPPGMSAGSAIVEARLASARYEETPVSIAFDDVAVSGVLSAADDPSQHVGRLALSASARRARAREGQRVALAVDDLTASSAFEELGRHDAGMWGLRGTGSLKGSVGRVSADAGALSVESNATVALEVDLATHRVVGSIPVESVEIERFGYAPIGMRDTQIGLVAREPLDWSKDTGAPTVFMEGSIRRVSVGKRRFRVPKWTLEARQAAADRYAIKGLLSADRLTWGSFGPRAKSVLSFQSAVDALRPALDASAALSVAGGAKTRLRLSASHDAPATRYRIDVRGTQAGPLLGAILFQDGGRRSDELSFRFQSRGALRGVLSKGESGGLALSERPLRSARGRHSSELYVERLSLQRGDVIHRVEGLAAKAGSRHEAPGNGTVDLSVRLDEARYGEEPEPMILRNYAQASQVDYAALHGAPSLSVQTQGTIGELEQPYVHQYPIRDVSFGAEVDVDDTQVFAVRSAYLHNPAGGTRFEAQGAYEGWRDAILGREVCTTGIAGCPEVASMYGREAATVRGTLEQDFASWQGTARAESGGSIVLPFTVESGDLNTYRIAAVAQIRDLVLELPQYDLFVEDLDARIPIEQEFATAPRFFVVPTKRKNAMAQKRFFDLYPFTKRDTYFTVDRVEVANEVIGPVAANLRILGSAVAIDQLHAGYREGFVTGQFLADLNESNPKIVFRGNITGVKPARGNEILDANLAVTLIPTTLIVEGKAQVVRVSKEHLYEILDLFDPYHEDEDLNRVRLGLKFGYPKHVRLRLDEGLMNAKVDLGGLAGLVRIDEIKGIPVTPFVEEYVQPYVERILSPAASLEAATPRTSNPSPNEAVRSSLEEGAVSEGR